VNQSKEDWEHKEAHLCPELNCYSECAQNLSILENTGLSTGSILWNAKDLHLLSAKVFDK